MNAVASSLLKQSKPSGSRPSSVDDESTSTGFDDLGRRIEGT